MASVKILLYTSKTLKDNRHPLMMQIIHNRKIRRTNLGFNLYIDEWDVSNSKAKGKSDLAAEINTFILERLAHANTQLMRLKREKEQFSLDELLERIKGPSSTISFSQFTNVLIERTRKANKLGNADSYQWALNAFHNFSQKTDLYFSDIDFKFLSKLKEYHLGNGNSINGLNVYLRAVRAIFNKAINEGVVSREVYPFVKFKIKNEITKKRAISKEDMQKIADLELYEDTEEWHTRNLFLFSFYTIGMNWSDMANLKIENINSGRVFYKRNKTHKEYTIAINPKIQAILDYYTDGKAGDEYVFSIIDRTDNIEDTRKDIRNKLKTFNKYLKLIGKNAGIEGNLTSYVARHSWASIANFAGIQLGVISQGMGHADLKTTQTYLAEFENSDIDAANANII